MSARLSSMSGRNLSTVHSPDTRKEERARQPAHRCARRSCALVSHRPGQGGERRRGNKRTNSSPPDGTGRTRRTAIVLRTPPHVLNDMAVHCGPPFGTKRPQGQILSPRPAIPQARGPHQKWCGPPLLRGAPKRNTEGTPPRVLRVPPPVLNVTAANSGPRSGRRGRRFKSCRPDQHSRRPEPPPEERNAEGTGNWPL